MLIVSISSKNILLEANMTKQIIRFIEEYTKKLPLWVVFLFGILFYVIFVGKGQIEIKNAGKTFRQRTLLYGIG